MLDLPDSWVWDFWFADDGERYHAFFLFASRALHDPERRHRRAGVGHAVSDDLVTWTRVADALVHGDDGDLDARATWTGSIVRGDDGVWTMFSTAVVELDDGRLVQRVTTATSDDLLTWRKSRDAAVSADPRWYETRTRGPFADEAWRDPWVFRDPDGAGWHMLVTARAAEGAEREVGVVGHARSADLRSWSVLPPLSAPHPDGFGQLEVMQVVEIDGRAALIFSCLPPEASDARRRAHPRGAIWAMPAASVTGPFRIEDAHPLAEDDLYVGRVLTRRDTGEPLFFAFRNRGEDGAFVGGITDPRPIGWVGDRLVVG